MPPYKKTYLFRNQVWIGYCTHTHVNPPPLRMYMCSGVFNSTTLHPMIIIIHAKQCTVIWNSERVNWDKGRYARVRVPPCKIPEIVPRGGNVNINANLTRRIVSQMDRLKGLLCFDQKPRARVFFINHASPFQHSIFQRIMSGFQEI